MVQRIGKQPTNPAATPPRWSSTAIALFLLGPMLLARYVANGRSVNLELEAPQSITVNHRTHRCDVLRARMLPGVGLSDADDIALYVGQDDHLVRRIRFTLNGLESTRGDVAQVDTFDHEAAHGVQWPTGFQRAAAAARLLCPYTNGA